MLSNMQVTRTEILSDKNMRISLKAKKVRSFDINIRVIYAMRRIGNCYCLHH